MALYAFDGTWNRRDRKEAVEALQPPRYGPDRSFRRDTVETNVHRFCEFYGMANAEYLQGVGTSLYWLGAAGGGAFGFGGRRRIRRMYRAFVKRYLKGDHAVDIIGFSRGAALAIHFSSVIDRYQAPRAGGKRHWAWHHYPGLGLTFRFPKLTPRRKDDDSPSCPIRFLGLWDTVASFGLPIKPFRNRITRFWRVKRIPDSVQRSIHAIAIDEVRGTFELIRPTPARETGQHYEVWFRGVHSNIGGGYPDRGLSDIALAWMMEMYVYALDKLGETPPIRLKEALGMLVPEPGKVPDWVGHSFETLEPNPDGEMGRPLDLRRALWRSMPAGALVHHSVYIRSKNQLLDHHRSNLSLLRTLPESAKPVYDPPLFYSDTPRIAAHKIALSAFRLVPVRSCNWLRIDTDFIFRSDDWIALGQNRTNYKSSARLDTFVAIATEWLLAGRPGTVPLKGPFVDGEGNTVLDDEQMKVWVLRVLTALDPYVPEFRHPLR